MSAKNSNSDRSHKHIDNDDGIDIRSSNRLAQNKPENEDSPISAAINLGFGDVTKNYVDDLEGKVLRSFSFEELLKQPIEQFGAAVTTS
jgi:hypothetical protein